MPNTKTSTQPEKVLEFVEITGAVLEKAAAMVEQQEAQDTKVAELIPAAVQALLDNERIQPHEKEAAEKLLRDPVKVLEVLTKTAQHRNATEQAKLGNPAETRTKKASYNSLADGYVGRRSRPDETESDKAFKRGLGF